MTPRYGRCFIAVILLLGLLCTPASGANTVANDIIDEHIAVLDTLGLRFPSEDIEALKASYAEFVGKIPDGIDKSKFTDYPQILGYLGLGRWDAQVGRYIPISDSVYAFDMECMDIEAAYNDFLNAIARISGGEISVSDIQSRVDEAVFEAGIGEQLVQFTLNGQACSFTANFQYDWFDGRMFDYVNEVLAKQGFTKKLWCMSDEGQGLVVFFNDQAWADEFAVKIGIRLSSDTSGAYYEAW